MNWNVSPLQEKYVSNTFEIYRQKTRSVQTAISAVFWASESRSSTSPTFYKKIILGLWPLIMAFNGERSSLKPNRVYQSGRGTYSYFKEKETYFKQGKLFCRCRGFKLSLQTDRNSNWMIKYSNKVAKAESKAKKVLFHLTHFAS